MTKKDYELIESAFIDRREVTNYSGKVGAYTKAELRFAHHVIDMLAIDLALKLEANDPKFDREKFLSLSGTDTVLRTNGLLCDIIYLCILDPTQRTT